MSGVYRVGAEQEMTVYSGCGSPKIALPESLNKVVEKVLPTQWAEKITGRRLDSWTTLYNAFLEEGGFQESHTKRFRHFNGFEPTKTYHGVWRRNGRYYGDGNDSTGHYPEFCTAITDVKKGFAEEATNAIMAHRAEALKVMGDGGKADVHNMHYNISADVEDFEKLPGTLMPAYALILSSDNRRIYKLARRRGDVKGGGIEIAGPALMDPEQIRAAYAFMAGTLLGRGRHGDPTIKMVLKEKPWTTGTEILRSGDSTDFGYYDYERVITFKSGKDYESSIMKKGPKATLRTTEGKMTARQYFKQYLDFYREDIEEVATKEEMKILDELAEGKRKFEIEKRPSHIIDADYILQTTGKDLDGAIDDFEPDGAAELFADSATNWWYKKIGKNIARTTKHIGWDRITFEFSDGMRTETIDVPLGRMEEYQKLEENLGSEKDPLKKLAEWEDWRRR